jgi:hypothetical protein
MRQKAQHFGELSDIRAAAAEFLRNTGFDQLCFLQKGIVLGDEDVVFIHVRRSRRKRGH